MCSGTYDDASKEEKRLLNDLNKGKLIADWKDGKLLPHQSSKDKPKPSGRKRKLLPPSVKEKAKECNERRICTSVCNDTYKMV